MGIPFPQSKFTTIALLKPRFPVTYGQMSIDFVSKFVNKYSGKVSRTIKCIVIENDLPFP